MGCALCESGNITEFSTEINIHLDDFKNLEHHSLFAFPKLLICLDCGFSSLTLLETDLRIVREGAAEFTAS
jgi:hypothetical protein